jgi:hypothetical protein
MKKKVRRPTEDKVISILERKTKESFPISPTGYTGFSDGADEEFKFRNPANLSTLKDRDKIVYSVSSQKEQVNTEVRKSRKKKIVGVSKFASHQLRETPEDSREDFEIDFRDFSEKDWEDFFDNELKVF